MKEQAIESFGDQGSADIFAGRNTQEARIILPRELHSKARTVMEALDKTEKLSSLKQFDIKQLSGKRSDQYSLRINRQYRICFEWNDGKVRFVQILDYHRGVKPMSEEIPTEDQSPSEPFNRNDVVPRESDPEREPVHPGQILSSYMEEDGWSQTSLSETMDVSRDRINKIVNGKRGISHETAIKLSIVFDNTSPDFWLGLDNARRLWEERQEKQEEFQKIEDRLEKTA